MLLLIRIKVLRYNYVYNLINFFENSCFYKKLTLSARAIVLTFHRNSIMPIMRPHKQPPNKITKTPPTLSTPSSTISVLTLESVLHFPPPKIRFY